MNIANQFPNLFSKLVVLSGVNSVDMSKINIPTLCICGTTDKNKKFMNALSKRFGEENTYTVNGDHGTFLESTFAQDTGENVRNRTEMGVQI